MSTVNLNTYTPYYNYYYPQFNNLDILNKAIEIVRQETGRLDLEDIEKVYKTLQKILNGT